MDMKARNRIMHESRVNFRIARFLNRFPQAPPGPAPAAFSAGIRPVARRFAAGIIEKVQVFPEKYNQTVCAPFGEQLQNKYSECTQDLPFARIARRPARNTCAAFQMLVF
jgi:hypothetical protein